MENLENNLLIAEFMGVKPRQISSSVWGLSNTPFWSVTGPTPEKVMQDAADKFGFDTDWNKLMNVVEKIEGQRGAINVCIYKNGAQIESRANLCNIVVNGGKSKMEATYTAVVEFIKWFNSQKGEGNV